MTSSSRSSPSTPSTSAVDQHTNGGLSVQEVVVRYGGLTALNGVSLHAPCGRITGLIGPNGAGKTTLFDVSCGFARPTRGRVFLDGHDVSRLRPAARARRGLGRTFQRVELFRSMTVLETVSLAVEARHVRSNPLTQLGVIGKHRSHHEHIHQAAYEIIDEIGIRELAHRISAELSTGQGRLLELARVLGTRPRLILLDEPSAGLDANETQRLGELLLQLVERHSIGVFLVEHDIGLVLELCDWVHVLDFGEQLFDGTPDAIRNSEIVRSAYLGRDLDV